METITQDQLAIQVKYKKAIQQIRSEIKILADRQRELRPQTKPGFTGISTAKSSSFYKPHEMAYFERKTNRWTLHELHIVYAIMRNKPLEPVTKEIPTGTLMEVFKDKAAKRLS